MKAFRNNGVEGGYGTLKTQNWLLGLHRSVRRADKVTGEASPKWNSISAAKEKPAKDNPWRFDVDMKARAVLLAFAEAENPAWFGSWHSVNALYGRGLIKMDEPPKRWASDGHNGFKPLGALFSITNKGREYIEWLKQKG
jgi:hypothetical protein